MLTPRIEDAVIQQHIGPVNEYNVEVRQTHGTTLIKQNAPKPAEVDEAQADRLQRIADEELLKAKADTVLEETKKQIAFSEMVPTEQRIHIEKYWTPIIQQLAKEHEDACSVVTNFEDDQHNFRQGLQRDYAYELKHPAVKTVLCNGETQFNQMLSSGSLHIEGYKLVEKRAMGKKIQMIAGQVVPVGDGPSKLVYIPVDVPTLMHLMDSDEAKQHSQQLYDSQLERLISRRKKAAVKLTEAKQRARDQLAAIPTFEQLISDAVKRAKK